MWQIFLGSFVLGSIHALIPNHWIPLIAISKAEKWTNKEALFVTFITGFSHTISTIIIGVIVGFAGIKLSESYSYITKIAAPIILLSIGIIYLLIDLKSSHHHFENDGQTIKNKKSKLAIILSLCIAMFFTPCIEIEAFYFQAGTYGWAGIWIVSVVYTVLTVGVMMLLVYLGMQGMKNFRSHFLEHHEKRITGMVLIAVGLVTYFVEL
jgi:nickel/cobalt transporter (NicO) family protein